MTRLAVLATILALAVTGCGGGDTGPESAPQSDSTPAQVFAATCGSCHTLAAASTTGDVGPDLDSLAPDAARVEQAIETGPSLMPEGLLTGAQADAVADYVAQNAGK